ncbi:alpha/beta fold hydrolase [Amycolatopsis endophytica]
MLAVQYPGREDRITEAGQEDARTTAAAVADALAGLAERPTILFGHSLGALIAYETARTLGGHAPAHLVVSGRRAPADEVGGDLHRQDDDALVDELDRLGGVGTELLRDPAVRPVFLPSIRADFRVAETYRHRHGPPLTCPVTAVIGTEDTEVDAVQAGRWAETTRGPFTLHTLPGGHFYLLPRQAAVHDLLRRLSPAGALSS